MAKKKSDFEKELEKLDKAKAKSLARETDYMGKEFQSMLDKQQDMLIEFCRAVNEDIQDELKDEMKSNQELMQQQLEDMKASYNTYGKYMTQAERKTFQEMFKISQNGMNGISKEMNKRFGEIEDDFEDMTMSLSDKIRNISEEIRDFATAANISDMKNMMEEQVDGYIENLRQLRARTGEGFDEEALDKTVNSTVKELSSVSRAQASEITQGLIVELGLRDMKYVENYNSELAALSETIGVAVSDVEDIIWKDKNMGQEGRMLRGFNNMALSMEQNTKLNTHADTILQTINENMDALYGVARGDSKKTKKMVTTLSEIQALQESAANDGVTNMTESLQEWMKLTLPEAYDNEQLMRFAQMTNMSPEQILNALQNGGTEGLQEIITAYKGMIDGKSDVQLYQMKDDLGFDYVNDMLSLQNVDLESLINTVNEADKSAMEAALASDDNRSLTIEANEEATGWIDEFMNNLTANPIISKITDFFGEFDIGWANAANLAIVSSELFKAGSNLFKGLLGKEGAEGLFGKIGTKLANKGFGSGIEGIFTKTKEKFSNLFKKSTSVADDVTKAAVDSIDDVADVATKSFANSTDDVVRAGISSLDDVAKAGLSNVDDVAKGLSSSSKLLTSGTELLGKAGSVISKAAGPLAIAGVAIDGVMGVKKSEEWFGTSGFAEKSSSAIGGALGGTGPGILDEGSILEKGMNIGTNALKGAAIGSIIPGVGTAIGAVVGAGLGAIGGESIAKAAHKVFEFAQDSVDATFEVAGAGVEAVSGVLNELGPVGEGLGSTLTESFNAVTDTKNKIEEVWADPNRGLVGRIGGTVSALFSGTGNVALSIIKGAKNTVSNLYHSFIDKATETWNKVKEFAKSTWDGIRENAKEIWGDFLEGVNTLAEAGATILEAGGSLAEGIGKGVSNAIGGSASGVGEGIGKVLSGAADVVGAFTGNRSVKLDTSEMEGNLTGDPILDRLDYLVYYTSVIAANSGGSSKGLIGGITSGIIGKVSNNISNVKSVWTDGGIAVNNTGVLFEIKDILSNWFNLYSEDNKNVLNGLSQGGIGYGLGISNLINSNNVENKKLDAKDMFNLSGGGSAKSGLRTNVFKQLMNNVFKKGISTNYNGGLVTEPTLSTLAEYGPELVIPVKNNGLDSLLKGEINSYDAGTSWVESDQVSLIHQGEMIVPASVNPLNKDTVDTGNTRGDNSDVVETLKWVVSRLEAKLDKVIESNNRRQPRRVDTSIVNAANTL